MASKAMAVVIGLAMASVACAGLEQCEKPPAVKKSRDGAKISRRGRILLTAISSSLSLPSKKRASLQNSKKTTTPSTSTYNRNHVRLWWR